MFSGLLIFLAQAAGETSAASPQAQPPSALGTMVPMICIFVIMYFLIIRPQQQKQKQLQERISALKTGDEVVVAGIHGVVANLKDGPTLTLKIADNVKIEVEKTAIGTVSSKSQA
jgi:preprotein translocase subunit YajC